RPEGKIGFIDLDEARQLYTSVSLPPSDEKTPMPGESALSGLLRRELDALNLKQVEKRLAIFKVWLNDDPTNTKLLLFLARSYGEVGIIDEAMTYARRAQQLNPKSTEVLQTLGNLAYLQNDTAEAIRNYLKADKIDHTAANQINLALAYLKGGQLFEARDAFKEAQRLDKKLSKEYPELENLLE
ncbi:MAG: hypothetical protein O3A51_12740, partial [Verrucomicrobia bacterium]|nr:hypothetical protein [Verrucomicrobiota bacterium]